MTPRFTPGDRVRVLEPAMEGHVRTPRYIRGKRGSIERVCGAFRNPEDLAYGRWDGERIPLYRVRFTLDDVWGTTNSSATSDTLDVEIYEHWLEPDERA